MILAVCGFGFVPSGIDNQLFEASLVERDVNSGLDQAFLHGEV